MIRRTVERLFLQVSIQLVLAFVPLTAAALELGSPFTDHAVLQRGKPVPVWGWSKPGAAVTVEFAGQAVRAVAAEDGRWKVALSALEASSQPRKMTITEGEKAITLKDILVGEVWMATGQSNMGWRIMSCRPEDRSLAIADRFDRIRIINVPKGSAVEPRDTCDAAWTPSTDKEALYQHSGCAYFFARELHENLKIPIGVIDPSYGGTHIDSWIAPDAWALEPSLAKTHRAQLAAPPDSKHGASRVFNAEVSPFVGYALRGFIWHQGEGNSGDGMRYLTKLRALINGYRNLWDDPSLSFAIGQLYPHQPRHRESPGAMAAFSTTRWAQALIASELEHVGTILLSDLGQPFDVHPDEKHKMGHRYALWARATVYGEDDLVYCGPIPTRVAEAGHSYHIHFDHVGGGLVTRDGHDPRWFRYQCEDGSVRAPRQIAISEDGDYLILGKPANRKSPAVKIQHGWHSAAFPNLMNAEGLPATVFEIDLRNEDIQRIESDAGNQARAKHSPTSFSPPAPAPSSAGLTMCQVFSDGMVLQREKPVPVWGWSKSGEKVTVAFAGQRHTATADEDGYWRVTLAKMPANVTPQSLHIQTSGGEVHEVKDVLVGEVWLGSGQSNMGWSLAKTDTKCRQRFTDDDLSGLRVFLTERAHAWKPQRTVRGRWISNADKAALADFQGLAYFFARRLHLELGVPVGMIGSSEGGSRIEVWCNREGLATQPALADYYRQRQLAARDHPESSGLELGRHGVGNYEAMIAPFVPYALRGFIWHQGESNAAEDAGKYLSQLHALTRGWRAAWDDATLSFGIGQLYAFDAPFLTTWATRENWIQIQWAQYRAGREIDGARCVVLSDLSTPCDIHPKNKSAAGERFAAWALCEVYGRDNLPEGPNPVSAVFDPKSKNFTLTFNHVGDGLKTSDGHDVKWFQIGDSTGRWIGARVRFLKDRHQLLLRTSGINQLKPPYRIRHAWSNVAMPNLRNSAGYPASLFEVDVREK